jgi:hypothetical protein
LGIFGKSEKRIALLFSALHSRRAFTGWPIINHFSQKTKAPGFGPFQV